ncbi:YHS domain-containing (seleno)protein [Aquimarina sp. W85]|uniref:YHS domain-containing (seleno)protein n=1 Tax=Aquimarina rhodophyticola TaxID=3342246 RepID=UPI00366E8234
MKMKFVISCLIFLCIEANAQHTLLNTANGYVVKGYDVVAYFKGTASKGVKSIKTSYKGGLYSFIDEENKNTFEQNPEKYVPQYGGYCAYAIATSSKKVDINPKTFEIRDDKLYLFYNAWGVNTHKKWKKENIESQIKDADTNWRIMRQEYIHQ